MCGVVCVCVCVVCVCVCVLAIHCCGCLFCVQCQMDLATDEEMFAEKELELAGLQEQVSTLVRT